VALGIVALVAAGLAWRALQPRPEWRPVVRELQPSYEENSDEPVFSPDGTVIAYHSDRERPGHYRIYVESLADGSSRAVTAPALDASYSYPSWTRDGQAILFSRNTGRPPDVLRIRLAGGEPELVVPGSGGAADCGAGRLVFRRHAGRDTPVELAARAATTLAQLLETAWSVEPIVEALALRDWLFVRRAAEREWKPSATISSALTSARPEVAESLGSLLDLAMRHGFVRTAASG
jgi:hypothetical protein